MLSGFITRFGRLAKGGTRVAYLKFVDRKSLYSLLKVLRTNPASIPSPSDSHDPSIRSPLLESHLNSCRSLYKTSPQELRKTAEAALVKFNEELDVREEDGNYMQGMHNETDEDGWTIIRRRTRVEDEELLTAMQLREKKRREKEMKTDFYKCDLDGLVSVDSKDERIRETN